MAWIHEVAPGDATGLLRDEFDAAIKRAGRIWKVLRAMSVNPEALSGSVRLYGTLMFGPSTLTRAQREMIGIVASAGNHCQY